MARAGSCGDSLVSKPGYQREKQSSHGRRGTLYNCVLTSARPTAQTWGGVFVTTPYGSCAEGECPGTGVSSHTVRQGSYTKAGHCSKQLMYRKARLVNAVAFLPLALCQRAHRNAMWLNMCIQRTISLFLPRVQKTESVSWKRPARFPSLV